MIGDVSAETLTDDEALALGLSSIVHAGQMDPDNYAVNAMLSQGGVPQVDREGRPIISFRQFEEVSASGGRVDGYAIRVMRPGHRGTWTVQASKYHKWFGLGYEAVGCPPDKTHTAISVRAQVIGELIATVELDDTLNENQINRRIHQFLTKHQKAITAEVLKRVGGKPSVARRPVRTVEPADNDDDTDVTFYRCSDKYPDCKRFFDNPTGLKLHWRKDHEGAFKPRKVAESS